MNLEQARTNMVEQQIRTWEVLDQDVLDLLYTVPREEFVPASCRNLAFTDMEIPLGGNAGEGARMWSPKMEARVLQELAPKRSDRVMGVRNLISYWNDKLPAAVAAMTSGGSVLLVLDTLEEASLQHGQQLLELLTV